MNPEAHNRPLVRYLPSPACLRMILFEQGALWLPRVREANGTGGCHPRQCRAVIGLGRVKTLHRKCRGIAILADCLVGAFFGFDYALIAAMSG